MKPTALYQPQILPALREIQHEHGYLKPEELKKLSEQSKVPLYRLEAVASFFPHFRRTSPPILTVRVCRDTACHLAGAGQVLKDLAGLSNGTVHVEGVSCLGRCDRPVASCVELCRPSAAPQPGGGGDGATTSGKDSHAGHQHDERYYLGRTGGELAKYLKAVVNRCRDGTSPLPKGDHDIDLAASAPGGNGRYPAADWLIDPYAGKSRNYAGVEKALGALRASLGRAQEKLLNQLQWPIDRVELFITALKLGSQVDVQLDKGMQEAMRDWQTEDGWAKGPELAGWADALLAELDKPVKRTPDLLRGMGGAGISAAQKWRDVRDAVRAARRRFPDDDDQAFIVVNGDESEPATFKDRELLLHYPHLVLEGMILAGLLTDASQGFIYIRHEYPEQIAACQNEIKRATAEGVFRRVASVRGRPFPVEVFISPGGYICGEQSALIEAMSDRRAEPRNMPPKLETNGLLDRPTLVSNVETFAWVPYIIVNSGEAYAKLGANEWRGRRFFSVCGQVNRPGVYEAPMGMRLGELINGEMYCQGIAGGKPLKGFAPSGPSGGFLPARLKAPRNAAENKAWQALAKRSGFDPAATDIDLLDLELELDLFRALTPKGALGAGLVVYAEGCDIADQAVNALQFFRNESCGKCVPCRVGSRKLASIGEKLLAGEIGAADWGAMKGPIDELLAVMSATSICALGRSVPSPLDTVMQFFPEDIEPYTSGKRGAATREP
jgi:NADH:ubiquinone oxidoreductase subunit F (NADH-binding)